MNQKASRAYRQMRRRRAMLATAPRDPSLTERDPSDRRDRRAAPLLVHASRDAKAIYDRMPAAARGRQRRSWLRVAGVIALAAILLACVDRGPKLPPSNRGPGREVADLAVTSRCGDQLSDAIRLGRATVVTPRRAVTALHVVECLDIPTVTGESGGRLDSLAIVSLDRSSDLALLELAAAGPAWSVAPPTLSTPRVRDVLCGPSGCGAVLVTLYPWVYVGVVARDGDSGAPMYDRDGRLAGVIVAGSPHHVRARLLADHRYARGDR